MTPNNPGRLAMLSIITAGMEGTFRGGALVGIKRLLRLDAGLVAGQAVAPPHVPQPPQGARDRHQPVPHQENACRSAAGPHRLTAAKMTHHSATCRASNAYTFFHDMTSETCGDLMKVLLGSHQGTARQEQTRVLA